MNIVLTNDDGYQSRGLVAAFEGICGLGTVHVVAPKTERSACSHTVTLRRPVTVEKVHQDHLGSVHAVDGTPADCVRLAFAALIEHPINLVVSGVNHGANTGVDTFYSGTVAAAREASILGIHAVALSLARRVDVEPDWLSVTKWVERIVPDLLEEKLQGPGFWNVNFPVVVPTDAKAPIQRVPLAIHPMPMSFDRSEQEDGRILQFDYGASYWLRDVTGPSDYSVVRDGGIAVTAIPLYGRF